MSDWLFVYGTLRRDVRSPMKRLLDGSTQYVGKGFLLGRLYEVDGYPGAVLSDNPSEKVSGELYRMTDARILLERLDAYEECSDDFPMPHEYLREIVPVFGERDETVGAWVYRYNRDFTNLLRIESGDYAAWYRAKHRN